MTSKNVVAFTSVNLAYLNRAVVLMMSVRKHHPDWVLVLVLVDEMPEDAVSLDLLARFDGVLLARDVIDRDFDSWIFKYDVIEACTAVKGSALTYLLTDGADRVVYLDPDMAILSPLDTVMAALASHPIAVTPHQLVPASHAAAVRDNEMGSLLTGVYNLGFLAVANTSEGRRFGEWWRDRLLDYCFDDPSRGLFTDQRWIDLAPVFFPDLHVLRDPGLNVASWNIGDRPIEVDTVGNYTAAGSRLKLFHFTKALGVGPVMTMRYAGDNQHVAALWRWYLEQLNEVPTPEASTWAYGVYSDDTPITPQHRRVYHARKDVRQHFKSPFDASGDSSLRSWMNVNSD